MQVVLAVLGVAVGVGGIAFWWWAMTRGQDRFRRRCERRYNVTITLANRGFWSVTGQGSWLRRFAIEWLQLAYIMGVFVVWAVGVMLVLVVMNQLD